MSQNMKLSLKYRPLQDTHKLTGNLYYRQCALPASHTSVLFTMVERQIQFSGLVWSSDRVFWVASCDIAMQIQTAVTAYFSSEQLLLFVLARKNNRQSNQKGHRSLL